MTQSENRRTVTRTAEVDAPPETVFALLADPRRHGELDGSGTVKSTVSGPPRLSEGARFSVGMKQYGVPYRITSRVTAFQDARLLEWRHPFGHRWRWELQPLGQSRTQVTETFDYSGAPGLVGRVFELTGIPKQNASGISATLDGLRRRFSAS